MNKLYENIKKRRIELNMSQAELAEKMGYKAGKSMISKIESGKVDLSRTKIMEMAKALDTTASDLMGWSPTDLITSDNDLIEIFNRLNSNEITLILNYANFLISQREGKTS